MKRNVMKVLSMVLLFVCVFCTICYADVINPYTNTQQSAPRPATPVSKALSYLPIIAIVIIAIVAAAVVVIVKSKKK